MTERRCGRRRAYSAPADGLRSPRSADRVYVFFDLSYEGQIAFYRAFVWVAPVLAFVVTRRICRELQCSDTIRAERERAEHEARQAAGVGATATVADA